MHMTTSAIASFVVASNAPGPLVIGSLACSVQQAHPLFSDVTRLTSETIETLMIADDYSSKAKGCIRKGIKLQRQDSRGPHRDAVQPVYPGLVQQSGQDALDSDEAACCGQKACRCRVHPHSEMTASHAAHTANWTGHPSHL